MLPPCACGVCVLCVWVGVCVCVHACVRVTERERVNKSDRVRCYSSHYDHIMQKLCPL